MHKSPPLPHSTASEMLCTATRASRSETGAAMALDRMAACQSWICFPLLQCHVFMVYVLLCWGVFFSVLRLYSKWSIVWGLKIFFSSSLSSCKKLYFLNTLSPVLSTPLSYVCCVCMDRLMANFAGTCTSDNKGLLLLLLHADCITFQTVKQRLHADYLHVFLHRFSAWFTEGKMSLAPAFNI